MRRQYITHPGFQASFTFSMVLGGVAVVWILALSSVGTLYVFLEKFNLGDMERHVLMSAIHTMFIATLIVSLAVAILLALTGVYFSYKFVGPLQRVEQWMERVLAGEKVDNPHLRSGDELETSAKLLFDILSKVKPSEPG